MTTTLGNLADRVDTLLHGYSLNTLSGEFKMNPVAAKLIEYARNDDYRTTAQLLWNAAREINKLDHENAELLLEVSQLKAIHKPKK